MSVSATADELDISSRKFHEYAKMKMAYSIVVAAGSMVLLAFAAIAGGFAKGNGAMRDMAASDSSIDDKVTMSYAALASGYGIEYSWNVPIIVNLSLTV
jgi:hypothetical protein